MAEGAIHATHIGLVKYAVRTRDTYGHFPGEWAAFVWISIGLYVPNMEEGLAIMSIPSHKKLGISLKDEGDDVLGSDGSFQPYLYPHGQTVHGIKGATCSRLEQNGKWFRGVETVSQASSNMILLDVLPNKGGKDRCCYHEINMITGKPFKMKAALQRLRIAFPQFKTYAEQREAALMSIDETLTAHMAAEIENHNLSVTPVALSSALQYIQLCYTAILPVIYHQCQRLSGQVQDACYSLGQYLHHIHARWEDLLTVRSLCGHYP